MLSKALAIMPSDSANHLAALRLSLLTSQAKVKIMLADHASALRL